MNARGYYIYPRLIELEHVSPVVLMLWEHLLSKARYRAGDGLDIGQVLTSIPELRKRLYWVSGYRMEYFSIDQIKRALKFLKRNLIRVVRKGKNSLITIKNYLKFSDPKWEGYSATEKITGAPTGAPEKHNGRTEQDYENDNDLSWLKDIANENRHKKITGAPTGAPENLYGRTERDDEKTNDINEMSTLQKQRAHQTFLTGAPMGASNEDFGNCPPFILDLNKENKIGNKRTLRPLSKTQKIPAKIIPYEKIVSLYHEILPELPKIRKTGKLLKTKIKKIWDSDKDYQNLNFWREFFEIVRKSDWLCGKIKEWRASLQWLLKPEKFENVYNGCFNNSKNLSSDLTRHNLRSGDRFLEIQDAKEAARIRRETEGRTEL